MDFVDRVHIRCCGNGYLGFRPYGGSLFSDAKKSKQKRLAPPLGASPRLGMPERRHCSVGRREGPSMAQRGYPGIHAGMPTPQCLRSAIVVNGASRSKAKARRPDSRPVFSVVHPSELWEQSLLARRPDCRPISPAVPRTQWSCAECKAHEHPSSLATGLSMAITAHASPTGLRSVGWRASVA